MTFMDTIYGVVIRGLEMIRGTGNQTRKRASRLVLITDFLDAAAITSDHSSLGKSYGDQRPLSRVAFFV